MAIFSDPPAGWLRTFSVYGVAVTWLAAPTEDWAPVFGGYWTNDNVTQEYYVQLYQAPELGLASGFALEVFHNDVGDSGESDMWFISATQGGVYTFTTNEIAPAIHSYAILPPDGVPASDLAPFLPGGTSFSPATGLFFTPSTGSRSLAADRNRVGA